MNHEYQQVEKFERRLINIHSEKFGMKVRYWMRDSDGCQGEFKSQKTVFKLTEAPVNVLDLHPDDTDYKIEFNFFESHEGKNKSDGIGSLVKMYLERAIRTKQNLKIQCAADAVLAINQEISDARKRFETTESTKNYKLWVVEEYPRFDRVEDSKGLKIIGIRQIHSLCLSSIGVIARKVSCLECGFSEICQDCSNLKISIPRDTITELVSAGCDEEDGEEDELATPDFESDDEADIEDATEASDVETDIDEETEFEIGDVVWVMWHRRFYAAKIVSLADVPEQFHRQLKTSSSDYLIVKFYADGLYTRTHKSKVDNLGENIVDKQRAKFNLEAYHEALADLVYD